MADDLTAEEFFRALHDSSYALDLVRARQRQTETRIAVRDGFACPAPDCGLRYRHQHDGVWWPPEGEPWPPRPARATQPTDTTET